MVAIYVKNLIKTFGDRTAVSIPDFYFPSNELIGLVGNNGAGKTTLFRLILNLIKADSGTVDFCLQEGSPTSHRSGVKGEEELISNLEESWKSHIAAYMDESFLIDFLTPKEFFAFIAKVNNIAEAQKEEQLESLCAFLGDDILCGRKYIRDLSAGNKQKTGIAAALLSRPKFLILDEPFNFLDPSSQNQLKKLLMEYKERHKASVLISSHNLHHTTDISDRILLMESGSIIKNIGEVTDAEISDLEDYFLL